MSKDLHSAILLCALLSSASKSSTTTYSLSSQVCRSATTAKRSTPSFLTLFGNSGSRALNTNNGHQHLASKNENRFKSRQSGHEVENNGQESPELQDQLGFFDPSFLPKDFKLRNALKALKKAAQQSSPVHTRATFLNPHYGQNRIKPSAYRGRTDRRVMPGEESVTKPLLESLVKKRGIATGVGAPSVDRVKDQNPQPEEVAPYRRTAKDSTHSTAEKGRPSSYRRKKYPESLELHTSRTISSVILEDYAERANIDYYSKFIRKALNLLTSSTTSSTAFLSASRLQKIPTYHRLRLCHALLITIFLEQPKNNQSSLSTLFMSTSHCITMTKQIFESVELSSLATPRHRQYYHSAHAQILALSGKQKEAMEVVEAATFTDGLPETAQVHPPANVVKGKRRVETSTSWIIIHTYRALFQFISASDVPNDDYYLHSSTGFLLEKWDALAPFFLARTGLGSFHHTRIHGTLLKRTVFQSLDRIEDLTAWYTEYRNTLLGIGSDVPRRSPSGIQQARNLGILLLMYAAQRIAEASPSDSFEVERLIASLSDIIQLMMDPSSGTASSNKAISISTFGKSTIPEEILLKCSKLLAKKDYLKVASDLLVLSSAIHRKVQPSVDHLSVSLAIAARRGSILEALDITSQLATAQQLHNKHIRWLILAYLNAPVYELQASPSPSPEPSDEGEDVESPNELPAVPDRIEEAELIFNRFLEPYTPTAIEYTMIINAYARRGNLEKVFAWIEKMVQDGKPELVKKVPWESAMHAFARVGDAKGVVTIWSMMRNTANRQYEEDESHPAESPEGGSDTTSFPLTTSLFNILLELMARRRDPVNAMRLWRAVVPTTNTSDPGSQSGITPTLTSFLKLLRAHVEAGDWRGVIDVWEELSAWPNISGSIFGYRHAEEGATQERNRADNIAIYNLVLRAHVALGTPFVIVNRFFQSILNKAKVDLLQPDSFTYTMMIISASDAGYMEAAMDLFHRMEETERRRALAINAVVIQGTSVPVHQYMARSRIDYRPIYALTYIMSGYLRHKDWPRAMGIYEEIKRRGLTLLPLTYALIIKSYTVKEAKIGNFESPEVAEKWLASLSGWNAPESRNEDHAIAPSRSIDDERMHNAPLARMVYPRAVEIAYTPLLVNYVREKNPEEVERLFEQMTQIGGAPSISALTTLMDAYRRVGNVEGVVATWQRVLELARDIIEEDKRTSLLVAEYAEVTNQDEDVSDSDEFIEAEPIHNPDSVAQLSPNTRSILCYPFTIYMDALSAHGHHQAVAAEWKRLRDQGFMFDPQCWNGLVVVLLRAGQVERAFEVVENVIIPWQEDSQKVVLMRKGQTSWLDEGQDQEGTGGVTDGVHRWSRRTVTMRYATSPDQLAQLELLARERRAQSPSSGATDDDHFVHELDLIRQIRRPLVVWKVHQSVVKALGRALMHMESGRRVESIRSADDFTVVNDYTAGDGMEGGVEDGPVEEDAGAVFDELRTIIQRYPRAVEMAYRYSSKR
ncbi:hypothetical protein CPB86DRAFT_871779 [Serendipita vermifera]|nr:hypothetical protein CPB86DRAFT_871779 [Serendipita vermifera]